MTSDLKVFRLFFDNRDIDFIRKAEKTFGFIDQIAMSHKFYSTLFFLLFVYSTEANHELTRTLDFTYYSYKKSSSVENKFRIASNNCEFNTQCADLVILSSQQNCILKCISKNCYKEVYEKNPLEEGEIDQRLNSFKGCYAKDIS